MTPQVRRRLLIDGIVQGVYFRDSTRQIAVELGVSGSARNLADGKVEVVLEGPDFAVERVIAWCRHGPARAHVEHLDVYEEPLAGESGFAIS